MSKRMDGLQLAAESTTNQPPVVWGQQEGSYEEQKPEQVQYMHNQGSGQNDFHGDTYNSCWRNHPNLKWGENQNQQPWKRNSIQNNFRNTNHQNHQDTNQNPYENHKTINLNPTSIHPITHQQTKTTFTPHPHPTLNQQHPKIPKGSPIWR
ncbi:hypothetical protein AHAS_Ahas20G0195800 [Arachis hypogaea]